MQEQLYKKEGFAAGTMQAVIGLVVGVGVAVLVIIFVGALSGQTYELVESDILAIGNNSGSAAWTTLNGTAQDLGHLNVHNASIVVLNSTSGVMQPGTLTAGNWSLSAGTGEITWLNNAYNNTAMTATFTYGNLTLQGNVRNSIAQSFEALEQVGNYMPVIVLAVVITLVLALVLSFGMGGRNSGMDSAL